MTSSGNGSGRRVLVAPSVLSADFANLESECRRVLRLGADWLHLDVMDGHFVPNLTIGAPVVKSVRAHLPQPTFLDAHLMVTNPETWIRDFAKAGTSQLTFHVEATEPRGITAQTIRDVHSSGMLAGISLKPGTPVEAAMPYVAEADLVLVMTVEPGFGGQAFMEDMMSKVREIRRRFPEKRIQVDGGLDSETVKIAVEAGADVVVAGNAIFKFKSDAEIAEVIAKLRAP